MMYQPLLFLFTHVTIILLIISIPFNNKKTKDRILIFYGVYFFY